MEQAQPSFAELEAALSLGLRPRRFELLRRVTDLFIANVDNCSDEQVSAFDELMERLVEKIERESLVELSGRLAPLAKAPGNVVNLLSRHDDIDVAQPVLEQSVVLTDASLIEIAKTKSQAHLAAIAGRPTIPETVTDVLVDRGDLAVARKVTANDGARFSAAGHSKVASRAEQDEELADAFVRRNDVPPELFYQVVQKATESVRQKLLANATPEMLERITKTVASISKQVAATEALRNRQSAARSTAPTLKPDTALLRAQVSRFAKAGKVTDLIDAFAILCGVSNYVIKNLVRQNADETIVILGKASGIGWPDLEVVLSVLLPETAADRDKKKALFDTYANLSNTSAQRILQFVRTSRATTGADIRKMM